VLSELDESLFHQIPSTFDHVGTSDPRFFDRWWFAMYEPGGRGAAQFTLAVYNNMNVVDAGFVAIHEGRQYNVRASRSLRPHLVPAVGPMRVEVIEPLKRLRLVAERGEHGAACDLEWCAALAPEEEKPHFSRVRGRVNEEYQRYDQIGTVDGWIEVGGSPLDVSSWWSCRDHSWGVRPSVGGMDPITGAAPAASSSGSLFAFLFFSTDGLAGHVQVMERTEGRLYLTGLFRELDESGAATGREVRATDVDLSLELLEDTRRFAVATFAVTTDDGRQLTLRCDALGPSIAMPGLGYSGGWNDGVGLGLWRGEYAIEHEVWDVRHPVDVIGADGTVATPVHRIQPVRVEAAGTGAAASIGTGSLTLIANGNLPRHGLGA
jgi:hypothetical protein